MGQPKKQKKKYERPKKPYDKERIDRERKIRLNYGLRRKKEIWRAEGIVRDFRRRARELQARPNETDEKLLLQRLNRLGIKCNKLDDVLQIGLDDILSRRLQTIIFKKGIANSMKHARQMVVHGHIIVDDRKVFWPSYIVEKDLEEKISLTNRMQKTIVNEEAKK
ncbi:MAG: 30S ribosomal protein S4 [Candidatus Aenigmarchaeota archaeon]|nr:30S ribosomal protein S4 [Candidatus Aenigmarchaeota archaeon]